MLDDNDSFPNQITRDLADLVVSGREFDVGRRRFKVKQVVRGHMSDVGGQCIPLVRQHADGHWYLGLYEDPEVHPNSPLRVALQLERVR